MHFYEVLHSHGLSNRIEKWGALKSFKFQVSGLKLKTSPAAGLLIVEGGPEGHGKGGCCEINSSLNLRSSRDEPVDLDSGSTAPNSEPHKLSVV